MTVEDHRPHTAPIAFGGLKGQLVYDDATFTDSDPEILQMFYGEDAELLGEVEVIDIP